MSRYKQQLRWEIKYRGLRTLNIIHYSYLFFYKINKGDLPLMYSCVFWCEFIDLVGFFGCYCLTRVTEVVHILKVQLLVTRQGLSCENINLHNTLVTWAWAQGECSSENFENTPKRYQNLVLEACPIFVSTLTIATNYITGTNTFFRSIAVGYNLTAGP